MASAHKEANGKQEAAVDAAMVSGVNRAGCRVRMEVKDPSPPPSPHPQQSLPLAISTRVSFACKEPSSNKWRWAPSRHSGTSDEQACACCRAKRVKSGRKEGRSPHHHPFFVAAATGGGPLASRTPSLETARNTLY